MSAAVTAETESGTSCIDSARRVAVTTTSPRTVGCAASAGAAAPAKSTRLPGIRRAGTWDIRRWMLIGRCPFLRMVDNCVLPNLLADFLFWQLFLLGKI